MQIQRATYLNQLITHKNNGLIKILCGMKGCGKSYLLSEIFTKRLCDDGINKDNIINIDLDNDIKYRDPDLCTAYIKTYDNSTY